MGYGTVKPCFIIGQDLVLPPVMGLDVYEYVPMLRDDVRQYVEERKAKGEWPPSDVSSEKWANWEKWASETFTRNTLLYFIGFPAKAYVAEDEKHFVWSFGVRQEMFRLYEDRSNTTGILMEATGRGSASSFLEMQRSSEFCLAPCGFGWGMRTTQVTMLECIPVIIQPDTVQPLEGDFLDWNDLGFVWNKSTMPVMEQLLREIPPETLGRKRATIRNMWTSFVWTSGSYNPLEVFPQAVQDKWAPILAENDVFVAVMKGLANRLER
eukprot:TRINITY_DN9917_c0_g2_i1.p1 TRINITY_DN9917_c0_g2~~TRINITY_DN9917_c0_g2_i1.p1  ORF type:complete len:308 (-),score=25.29 TRINITY_DN9917_c0_g2_i1:33-833(-)